MKFRSLIEQRKIYLTPQLCRLQLTGQPVQIHWAVRLDL